MTAKRMKFSVQFKEQAVAMVVDGPRTIAGVAEELNVNPGTLGTWVERHRSTHPVSEAPLNVPERIRMKELEAENRELRMKNEFLGKAAAFFARELQ